MPTLKVDTELRSRERPDYGALTERQLFDGFVALFNKVIPVVEVSNELNGGGPETHKVIDLDREGSALDFADNYFGYLIGRSGNHGRLHTRELTVPIYISAAGVAMRSIEPTPVIFEAQETSVNGHSTEQELTIIYGDGRFGAATMRYAVSRRHWGIGIEAMKAVDLEQAYVPVTASEQPATT